MNDTLTLFSFEIKTPYLFICVTSIYREHEDFFLEQRKRKIRDPYYTMAYHRNATWCNIDEKLGDSRHIVQINHINTKLAEYNSLLNAFSSLFWAYHRGDFLDCSQLIAEMNGN